MPDLPTRATLFAIGRDELLRRAENRPTGRRITPEEIDTPGSDINLLMAGSSVMGEEVVRQSAQCITDLTLDGAEGPALDRWVADRYSTAVVRKTATPALVQLTLTRTSGGAAGTYEAGSTLVTPGGTRFITDGPAAFPVGSNGPITVNARAVDAGLGGNVAAGTITRFVTAPFDLTMSVTNSTFASGGADTESDAALRSRARLFFLQARRGTLGAIEFGALTVPGVVQATAEEGVDGAGRLTGVIRLFIADANGQANLLLVERVRIALLEFRAGGIQVDTSGATPVFEEIQFALAFQANVDTSAAFEQVRALTVARVNQLAPNEVLDRSLLFEVARSVAGVIVRDSAVPVPAGDIVPAQGQIIRTRPDLVTVAP